MCIRDRCGCGRPISSHPTPAAALVSPTLPLIVDSGSGSSEYRRSRRLSPVATLAMLSVTGSPEALEDPNSVFAASGGGSPLTALPAGACLALGIPSTAERATAAAKGETWECGKHTAASPTDAYGCIDFKGGTHTNKAQVSVCIFLNGRTD